MLCLYKNEAEIFRIFFLEIYIEIPGMYSCCMSGGPKTCNDYILSRAVDEWVFAIDGDLADSSLSPKKSSMDGWA